MLDVVVDVASASEISGDHLAQSADCRRRDPSLLSRWRQILSKRAFVHGRPPDAAAPQSLCTRCACPIPGHLRRRPSAKVTISLRSEEHTSELQSPMYL